jgi:hypothetical protein
MKYFVINLLKDVQGLNSRSYKIVPTDFEEYFSKRERYIVFLD